MTDPSDIKINGINEFINYFHTKDKIIDLTELKENFELDKGEVGFWKLSLSEKIVLGEDRYTETYNRPPIGPIERGTYCTHCKHIGPMQDHSETCPFPVESSLNLTLSGFYMYIIRNVNYSGVYLYLREPVNDEILTQDDINQILLIPNQVEVVDGKIVNISESNIKTKISYKSVHKKRGPEKLAPKTTTTQFLNNVIISYENKSAKSSIRISKNGLINIINTPILKIERELMITELIKRINESESVNLDVFSHAAQIPQATEYFVVPRFSYIHSAKAQFSLWRDSEKYEINYNELDRFISPYNSSGNIIPGRYSTIVNASSSKQIIVIGSMKIVKWEYSEGKETRQGSMSKSLIKLIVIPRPGIKMTVLIHKHGSFQMTLSYCSPNLVYENLCEIDPNAVIDPHDFNIVRSEFIKIFNQDFNILVRESLKTKSDKVSKYDTVSGYAPPHQFNNPGTEVCRATRKRTDGTKERVRPIPYGWKGQCEDPNYQRIMPMGVKGADDRGQGSLYYPCCSGKDLESNKLMRDYLKRGFPRNQAEANKYNTAFYNDPGSGILIPGSRIPGAKAMVKVGDDTDFQLVTVVKEKNMKENKVIVRLENGKQVEVSGMNFLRDSRPFIGLEKLDRNELMNCVGRFLKVNNLNIDVTNGKLVKSKYPFTTYINNNFTKLFRENVHINFSNTPILVFSDFNLFEQYEYSITSIPSDTYHFYFVLSPIGNYYITKNGRSIDSDINEKIDNLIILDGFLRESEDKKEYFVIDILYYDDKNILNDNFKDRQSYLDQVSLLHFNELTDDEDSIFFPQYYNNIIEGANKLLASHYDDFLIFMPINLRCCEFLIWHSTSSQDEVILQILSKMRRLDGGKVVKLGYNDEELPQSFNLEKLNEYTLPPKSPKDINVGDYILWKINRDVSGNIVPTRILSVIGKVNKPTTENNIMLKKIELALNPVPIEVFIYSDDKWNLPNKTLIYDEGGTNLLIKEN